MLCRTRRDSLDPMALGDPPRVEQEVQRKRVLVVDDHEDVRESICHLLKEIGYEPFGAEHGAAGLHVVLNQRPDVIILDLMMPIMSGWELWDRLQARADLADIPVIVITAGGLGQGAFGRVPVLRKPFDVDRLLDEVANACRK